MNKPIKIGLAITGVGLIGYAIWRYIKVQQDLLSKFTYKIVGLKFSHIAMDDVSADMVIRFNSIADLEVQVKNFYVDFYLNGIHVGYFENIGAFTIVANGSADIPIVLRFNPQLIFSNIVDLSLISINIKDVAVSVRGYADISSGFISATIPVSYDSTIKQIMSE